MIFASFLTSVEFYVIAAVIAAAIIGYSASPGSAGEIRKHLLAGTLCLTGQAKENNPAIAVRCLENGDVLLTRTGIEGMSESGAVSIVVTVKGFDIQIEEKLIQNNSGTPVDTALFTLDFLGLERYSIRYDSPDTGLFAAFTLNNRPGMQFSARLDR